MMTLRMPGNAKLNALGEKCVLSRAVAVRGVMSASPKGLRQLFSPKEIVWPVMKHEEKQEEQTAKPVVVITSCFD